MKRKDTVLDMVKTGQNLKRIMQLKGYTVKDIQEHLKLSTPQAIYDQFIMHMSYDEAVAECLHGVAEDVAGYYLDDVLHELGAIGFDAFPFFCGADAFIGDGFTTKLVLTDLIALCKSCHSSIHAHRGDYWGNRKG